MKNKGRAIFDNAGGITLQLGNWAHYYGGYEGYIEQAAEDYKQYMQDGNTDDWDGHEGEASELPSQDEIRNGGYKVLDADDIQQAVSDPDFDSGWANVQGFIDALIKYSKCNFEKVGHWWNDSSVPLIKIDGSVYALSGWNGEKYLNCWKCTGEGYMDASEEEYEITPVYREVSEDEFEVIGYDVKGGIA